MNELLATHLIKVAQSQIGVKEQSENMSPEILEYMRSTWMPEEANEKGYAWCAAFLCWCMTKACQKAGLNPSQYVYQGADAFGWDKWAKKRGWTILDENQLALPGSIVTFDFSHVGIVIEDKRDYIETVEGNTNADGEREGDGVYLKKRYNRESVRHFINYP